MKLAILNKICFVVAVASIVAGALLGVVMIWGGPDPDEVLWRLFATVSVVFLASFATLSVSRTYAQPPGGGNGDSVLE